MLEMPPPNPSGLCMCECGIPTPLARQTDYSRGLIRGLPIRFIHNHHGRKTVRYLEKDQGYKTPCWVWQLSISEDGYGVGSRGRKKTTAHRIYYEKYKGKIPLETVLDHLCHDPKTCQDGAACPHRRCVNPSHLEPVSSLVNTRRGLNCKISAADVPEIRAMHAQGLSYPKIGHRFGITAQAVYMIIRGNNWKGLE